MEELIINLKIDFLKYFEAYVSENIHFPKLLFKFIFANIEYKKFIIKEKKSWDEHHFAEITNFTLQEKKQAV